VRQASPAFSTSTSCHSHHHHHSWVLIAQVWLSATASALVQSAAAIRSLSVRGCGFGSAGGNHLAGPIATLTALTSLNLSHNRLCTLATWRDLGGALQHATDLEALDLSHNHIDEGCALMLAKALHPLTALRSLSLRGTRLDLVAACDLVTALPSLPSLAVLDLSRNPLLWFGHFTAEEGAEKTSELGRTLAALPSLRVRCPAAWHAVNQWPVVPWARAPSLDE
jgi:hypothetical protein